MKYSVSYSNSISILVMLLCFNGCKQLKMVPVYTYSLSNTRIEAPGKKQGEPLSGQDLLKGNVSFNVTKSEPSYVRYKEAKDKKNLATNTITAFLKNSQSGTVMASNIYEYDIELEPGETKNITIPLSKVKINNGENSIVVALKNGSKVSAEETNTFYYENATENFEKKYPTGVPDINTVEGPAVVTEIANCYKGCYMKISSQTCFEIQVTRALENGKSVRAEVFLDFEEDVKPFVEITGNPIVFNLENASMLPGQNQVFATTDAGPCVKFKPGFPEYGVVPILRTVIKDKPPIVNKDIQSIIYLNTTFPKTK